MDLNDVQEIIELFSKSNVDRLKLEVEGMSLALGKKRGVSAPSSDASVVQATYAPPPLAPAATSEDQEDENLTYVESPIVGTFYRAPNPSADPFVSVGTAVNKGQTLCIVEAMKLMNEIQAEEGGVIKKILVENGEGVEFGQKLFAIQPN